MGDDGGKPVEEARPRFKESLCVPELILNDRRLVEVVPEPPIGLEQEQVGDEGVAVSRNVGRLDDGGRVQAVDLGQLRVREKAGSGIELRQL